MHTIYFVVPCYNEQEVLGETAGRLKVKAEALIQVGKISPESRIMLVDDGSKDKTWEIISRLHNEDAIFSGVKLSRNRGHQNALLAGLMTAKERCDATISLDADLQDDIDAIDGFVDAFSQGNDVVYGVRSSRTTDTLFKRSTAQGFYRLMAALGVDIVDNHADYRLLSRRALEALAQFDEVNLFLRGIVPLIGFRSAQVSYERHERFAGESKYPLKKMLAFAFDGITSFSVKPMKLITTCGMFLFCGGALSLLAMLAGHIISGGISPIYPLMGLVTALAGLQIFAIGLVGQYVGKAYAETKRRPRYILEEVLDR